MEICHHGNIHRTLCFMFVGPRPHFRNDSTVLINTAQGLLNQVAHLF